MGHMRFTCQVRPTHLHLARWTTAASATHGKVEQLENCKGMYGDRMRVSVTMRSIQERFT